MATKKKFGLICTKHRGVDGAFYFLPHTLIEKNDVYDLKLADALQRLDAVIDYANTPSCKLSLERYVVEVELDYEKTS